MRVRTVIFSSQDAYARWRDRKLQHFPHRVEDLMVEVKDLTHVTAVEQAAVRDRIVRAGLCIYKGPAHDQVEPSKRQVRALGRHFGLETLDQNPYADEDALTPLHVAAGDGVVEGGRKMYIPYTNRALNWHTDGYYNPPERRICAMILHCVRAAGGAGGDNQMFDPDMAYLLMRESDPEMIAAFCRDDVLTIPGNLMDDHVRRGAVVGPVFSFHEGGMVLHMRYTARPRHVVWAKDEATLRARAFMQDIFLGPHTFHYRLEPGEGLLCQNILHSRTAFEDTEACPRMILRGRYLERICA